MINEDDLEQEFLCSPEKQYKFKSVAFDFLDTLFRIKKIKGVIKVCVDTEKFQEVFVVIEKDDAELMDTVTTEFAKWEAEYHIFPELHVINEDEMYYVPTNAEVL